MVTRQVYCAKYLTLQIWFIKEIRYRLLLFVPQSLRVFVFICQVGHRSLPCGTPVRRGHAESTHRPEVERNRQGKQIHTPGPQGWQRIQSQNL